jgi:hypothetical protein
VHAVKIHIEQSAAVFLVGVGLSMLFESIWYGSAAGLAKRCHPKVSAASGLAVATSIVVPLAWLAVAAPLFGDGDQVMVALVGAGLGGWLSRRQRR